MPVLDDERHLIGITGLRSLVLAPTGHVVGELMTIDVVSVTTDTDREDPAVVSAPFITTPVDATGLVFYFTFAKMILGI